VPPESPRVALHHQTIIARAFRASDPTPTVRRRFSRNECTPLQARNYLRWINASLGDTLQLITVEDVLYFQSTTKYTRVVTADGEALIRKPLSELLVELDPAVFWPIHRSTVVNAHAIAGVSRDLRGRLSVMLKQRAERLPVSESQQHRFRRM
jgi:DNA-binding LytR/AlgR family response regulator